MDKTGKIIRFRNNGTKYITEYLGDNFVSDKSPNGLIKGVAMFRVWNEGDVNSLGCVSFTISLLVGLTRTGFPSKYKENVLVNLLNYLPFNLEKCIEIYPNCYEYRFDSGLDEDVEETSLYRIKAEGTFESIFQRLIFGETVTNKKIQEAIKEILFNNWELGTNSNVLFETILEVLPIPKENLLKNIRLLIDDDEIRALLSPADNETIISMGLKPKSIHLLEGDKKQEVEYKSMNKYIYGTNIEATTHGANSPVTIRVDEIETVFKNIQNEIKENSSLSDDEKRNTSLVVENLQTEITEAKNPKKVAELVKKLKNTASWVWQKILVNPYVSGAIIELLSKAALS